MENTLASRIIITYGTGEAATAVGAYHAALLDAGIAHYNFGRDPERCVVPKHSIITLMNPDQRSRLQELFPSGSALEVEIARNYGTQPGRYPAGLGWYHNPTDTHGFLIRYMGVSHVNLEDESSVKELIRKGMQDVLTQEKKEWIESLFGYKAVSIRSAGKAVASVVAAIFLSEYQSKGLI